VDLFHSGGSHVQVAHCSFAGCNATFVMVHVTWCSRPRTQQSLPPQLAGGLYCLLTRSCAKVLRLVFPPQMELTPSCGVSADGGPPWTTDSARQLPHWQQRRHAIHCVQVRFNHT